MDGFKHYLGANIKNLREQLKLTKEELAGIVGASGPQIGYLERNETANPSYFLIDSLASYFGVDVHDIVWRDLTHSHPIERLLKGTAITIDGLSDDKVEYICDSLRLSLNTLCRHGYFRYENRQIRAKSRTAARTKNKIRAC